MLSTLDSSLLTRSQTKFPCNKFEFVTQGFLYIFFFGIVNKTWNFVSCLVRLCKASGSDSMLAHAVISTNFIVVDSFRKEFVWALTIFHSPAGFLIGCDNGFRYDGFLIYRKIKECLSVETLVNALDFNVMAFLIKRLNIFENLKISLFGVN